MIYLFSNKTAVKTAVFCYESSLYVQSYGIVITTG